MVGILGEEQESFAGLSAGFGRKCVVERPELPSSREKSQGGSVERLWCVVGFERLFCPTGEARHSLGILKAPVPAGFVFAYPAPFFLLAQKTRVTENRTLCFYRKGMHGIQEKGVCVLCHRD